MSIKFLPLFILMSFASTHLVASEIGEAQIIQLEKEKQTAYSRMHFSAGGFIGISLNALLRGPVVATSPFHDVILADSALTAAIKRNFHHGEELSTKLFHAKRNVYGDKLLPEPYGTKKHRWLHYARSFLFGVAAGAATPSAIKLALDGESVEAEELYGPGMVNAMALAAAGLLSLEMRRTARQIQQKNPIKNV